MSLPQAIRSHVPGVDGRGEVACLVAGGLLALLGLRRSGGTGLALAAAGSALALYGGSGLLGRQAGGALGAVREAMPAQTIKIRRSVTIGRPRPEVWRFLRDFSNFRRFASHVESVTELGGRRSHWVVAAADGGRVAWNSVIESEVENERISWTSEEGADIRNAGVVALRDAPGGRGTEVHLRLAYDAPAGPLGRLLAYLLGENPDQQARDDLGRLQQLLETGEIASNAMRRAHAGRESL